MDDEEDVRPLNPTRSSVPAAKKKGMMTSMIACTTMAVMISITFLMLTFQSRTPEMDMFDAMDWSANPCENFYQYACGGWLASTQRPADRSSYMRSFSVTEERNMAIVKSIILDEAATDPFSRIGNYYTACMNLQNLEILGNAPLLPLLNFTTPTWPEVFRRSAILQKSGFSMFWDFDVSPDMMQNSRYLFEIDQGGLLLPLRMYTKVTNETQRLMGVYEGHIASMFLLSGFSVADSKTAAKRALTVERLIANCTADKRGSSDPRADYNIMTIPQLTALSPNIPWSAWLTATMGTAPLPSVINVVSPTFFGNFSKILTAVPPVITPADAEAYIKWHVINSASIHLSQQFVDTHFNFFGKELSGAEQLPPREKICVERTHGALTDLVVAQFMQRVYDPETDKIANELISQLITAFKGRMTTIAWMDSVTRAAAITKLEAIVPMVAGPNATELRNYSTIDISKDDLFGNWIRVSTNAVTNDIAKLPKTPDRLKWHMAADEVNAYYDPDTNTIVFPVGILQPTFFSNAARPSMNYGGVGSVIGHEMTHGFDNHGRLFDAKGNLRDWWSPESAKNFVNRTQCVIKYYTDLGGDGENSLTENLADMGGVKTAYEGFLQKSEIFKTTPIQSPITPAQMFFVAFAQNWCELITPRALKMQILTDVHSPSTSRVQGTLANFDQFAAAFQCPLNSTYNPPTRCGVW